MVASGPDLISAPMADHDTVTNLGRLLGRVAEEHHEETGGTNHDWAGWYARRLQARINSFLGFEPSVEEITAWLKRADEEYRAEPREIRWPFFYAELILDSVAAPSDQ